MKYSQLLYLYDIKAIQRTFEQTTVNGIGNAKGANAMSDEKRLYPRLTLNMDDGYFGNFLTAEGQKIVASIVNISAGGISILVGIADQKKINEGDTLQLKSIIGGANLAFMNDIRGSIRWIKDLGQPEYVSVGCKFLDLSDASRVELSRFVDAERRTRGQYD